MSCFLSVSLLCLILEAEGLVHCEQFNEIPPHVEHSLTESGQALVPIFEAIGDWSTTYLK